MTTSVTDPSASATIRQATRADLLDVFRIERASFPQPWPYTAFEHFLGQPGFLVADAGSRVVGYVVADSVPNGGRGIGHIKDIAVRPEVRGRGLGATLLGRALAVLASQGARSVKLEVRESNDVAIELYRAFEFEHHRTIPRYYRNGENALVMARDVDPSIDL